MMGFPRKNHSAKCTRNNVQIKYCDFLLASMGSYINDATPLERETGLLKCDISHMINIAWQVTKWERRSKILEESVTSFIDSY